MKHDALIAPDESQFAFTPKILSTATFAASEGATDFVTVPDAHLLFNGAFKRAGDDLKIVGEDGDSFVVTDYFKHDKRPTLLSPEGASLTDAVVEALAGPLAPGQYAQAGTPQPAAQAIGRVEKVEGNATVVRNGVTITLNAGDVVMKGDVAQTGAGGSLAIVFADGTAFNLGANARMVLNDFVYSAGGGSNSALFSLVQGSISFVAGQVAKTGDMRVETPVATMGIRGTAVLVEISANDGQTRFSVMVEPDGTTGSYNLYDRTSGALIATVNSSAIGWVLTPAGPLQVLAQQVQKTPAELARELAIVQQVFQTFNSGPFDPNAPQPPQPDPNDPGRRGDNPQNTQTAQGTQFIPSGNSTVTVTVTQLGTGNQNNSNNNQNNNTNDTDDTDTNDTDDDETPVDDTPTTTFTVNNIYGTALNDTIDGTSQNDFVYAGAGNDTIIAAHGGGNDFYDGDGDNGQGFAGPGFDTIKFESANGVIFDLFGIAQLNRAFSASTGLDNFTNIEKIIASPGDDVFYLYDTSNWHIDAGGGIDIIRLVGGLDIDEDTEGPDVVNFEIVDLVNGGQNTVGFEGGGILNANEESTIRVLGEEGDIVNLSDRFDNGWGDEWENSHWELVSQVVDPFEDHYSDGVSFYEYQFVVGDYWVLGTVYVQQDVGVVFINDAPEISLAAPTYLMFDGNDYAASTAPASIQIDNVTIEGWIRWDGTQGSYGQGDPHPQVLLYNGNTSTAGYGLIGEVVGGSLHILGLTGGQNILVSDAFIGAGEWHHVALVREDGTFRLYVDGVEASLTNANSAVSAITAEDDQTWPDHTMVGGNPTNQNEGFHGDIAEVRLWDVARTQSEIADARFGSILGDEAGLAGYWPLNEGTGAQATDYAAPAANLQFSGQPQWVDTGDGWPRTGVALMEDGEIVVRGVSISDPDAEAGQDDFEVTLTVAHGSLTLADICGVDVTEVDGGIKLTGTLDDINAAVAAGVLYTPDENFAGDDSITVVANDLGHSGDDDIERTDTAQIAVRVESVNDAPIIQTDNISTQDVEGTEHDTTVFGLSVSDDAGVQEELTITAHANDGMLKFAGAQDEPLETLSFEGTLSEINAKLSSGVTYVAADLPALTDKVTLTITDALGAMDTVNFVFSVAGQQDAELVGGQEKDIIVGTGYNDTLTGGGSADTFVFMQEGFGTGQDTITDFIQGQDKIALYDLYSDFAAMQGAFDTQNNRINLDPEGENWIAMNVRVDTLTANDFIFHA